MPSASLDDEIEPIPSVKDLASSDPSIRRKCLSNILSHLSTRKPTSKLTPTQNQQLWRAFSVALYMHDSKNQLSVQKLIETLASTIQMTYAKDMEYLASTDRPEGKDDGTGKVNTGKLEEQPVKEDFPWLTRWHLAFWDILCREWSGIDQWRMNKYLLLIRFVIREVFSLMFSALTDENVDLSALEGTRESVFQKYPLSPRERKVPDGMRLHVLDVWLDELQKAKEGDELKNRGDQDGGSRKRKREDADDAGKNDTDQAEEEGEESEEETDEEDGSAGAGDGDDEDGKLPEPKQRTQPKPRAPRDSKVTARQRERLVDRLMDLIRALAKESISKSVRTKAKEIIKTYDEEGLPQ